MILRGGKLVKLTIKNGTGVENDLVSEDEQPIDELKEYQDMDFVTAMLHQSHSSSSITGPKHSIQRAWKLLWNQHRVVKGKSFGCILTLP